MTITEECVHHLPLSAVWIYCINLEEAGSQYFCYFLPCDYSSTYSTLPMFKPISPSDLYK